ncbi:Protein of unknown function [Pyronema omphalodes CBS 100304]|nr:Protein of unknown function [Pyronema omphalodes CBS 100304]
MLQSPFLSSNTNWYSSCVETARLVHCCMQHEKSKLSNVLHTLAPAITAVAPDFTAPASVSVSRDWHWSIGHWKASVATGSDP